MLPQILILLGVLVALWLAYDWFTRAKPRLIARSVKGLGLAVLVALGLWLVVTGKLAGLFAIAIGLTPWIARALRAHALWRMVKQFGVRMGGGQASAGNASQVETRFLRMELDHDSGRLDGEILEGPWRGRQLSGLSFEQAVDLLRQVQLDPDSARVLEAWIERKWPDWRERESSAAGPAAPRSAAMSVEEARDVLGLGADAGPDDIRAAHRRLMMANHPDHGGSTWIAARLNQARDRLLGD
jgi:hypothetical protein